MTGQCKHCTLRGDIKACKAEPCSKHEDWYAVQLQQENAALKAELEAVKESNELLEAANLHYKLIMLNGDSINNIKADVINDLISSKFTNVYIEGCEWPVIYVEDAHAYANNLESKQCQE